MIQEIFDDCFESWNNSNGKTPFWDRLAKKWGYSSGERIRQDFKYEAKKRKIKKNDVPMKRNEKNLNNNSAKILLFDIETTPIQAFVWGLWDQNVNIQAICQDWHLICWSAKWLFDSEIMSDVITPEEAKNHDDSRTCKTMWSLMNEADIIITHNGNGFDIKRLYTRFAYNDMLPPKAFYLYRYFSGCKKCLWIY